VIRNPEEERAEESSGLKNTNCRLECTGHAATRVHRPWCLFSLVWLPRLLVVEVLLSRSSGTRTVTIARAAGLRLTEVLEGKTICVASRGSSASEELNSYIVCSMPSGRSFTAEGGSCAQGEFGRG
jgi:hypothetical protein